MPDQARSPQRPIALALAVPVLLAVYAAVACRAAWRMLRPTAAIVLGSAVIGAIYADEARRRAPAGLARGMSLLAPRLSPARAAVVLAIIVAFAGNGVAPAPAAAAGGGKGAQIVAATKAYLGKPFRLGTQGPHYFDCSGLVYRVFADIGAADRIGSRRLGVRGYMQWFSARGLTSKSNAVAGDLVVYANGAHMGIYLGNGKVISAITTGGVSIHPLTGYLNTPFTMFL
ncbi:MAG TPA: NlpC/P60 family protein, partial [Candidatus Limnocylindria bacterium]|nr:NlpC/P60 family protein [Candidatus Limnocylindria bacterium]